MILFVVFFLTVSYVLGRALGYGLSFAGIMLIISGLVSFISYYNSDKIVLSMSGAKPADKKNYRELYTTVENLSIASGLTMPRVYIIEDPSPNAFATGRDPKHAAVAATTGLLTKLKDAELEGVIAHELSHVGNRDMLVSTVAVVLAGFVAIVADIFLRMSFFGRGGDRENHLSPIVLALGIVGIILAPLAAQLLRLAISRKREYLADASGALLTRYPEGLASALEKIGAHARPMRRASHATAHLFISDPFGGMEKRSFTQKVAGLFATHPPVADRVRAIRDIEVK